MSSRYWPTLGSLTSARVRLLVLLAPAYTSARSEISPLLLEPGLVWPNLNVAHSGRPCAAQPWGSRARPKISDQPPGSYLQPMSSAMGCHMAMTTGESSRFCVGLTRSFPVLARDQ